MSKVGSTDFLHSWSLNSDSPAILLRKYNRKWGHIPCVFSGLNCFQRLRQHGKVVSNALTLKEIFQKPGVIERLLFDVMCKKLLSFFSLLFFFNLPDSIDWISAIRMWGWGFRQKEESSSYIPAFLKWRDDLIRQMTAGNKFWTSLYFGLAA